MLLDNELYQDPRIDLINYHGYTLENVFHMTEQDAYNKLNELKKNFK